MSLLVYCEHGAIRPYLRKLASRGRIKLVHFPYDPNSRTRHLEREAACSEARWEDMNVTWDESDSTWKDCSASEKLPRIQELIGRENRRDALHLDSAYKSCCAAFITTDRDILDHRSKLETELGFRIFNPDDDADALLEFLTGNDRTTPDT